MGAVMAEPIEPPTGELLLFPPQAKVIAAECAARIHQQGGGRGYPSPDSDVIRTAQRIEEYLTTGT
jgi:hypothetical protein